ncbi:MAG: GNAT family N-acetyltransferase [Acidimicrobiia bacterium]|nr:GNAT family N-acetyltransferase [Acidimicrobiia bacterium]
MTDRRPKIAHLTTVDLSLRYLIMPQLLAPSDHGIDSVGISAPGPWVAELESRGIRHVPLASSTRGVDPLADLKAMWELVKVIRRERPDILHTHNPKPGIYGRIIGRLMGVPIVVNTVHGIYAAPDDPLLKRAVVYTLEAVASRFSDAELVQSAEDAALMRRLRIAHPDKIQHLGNGVDLDRFDPRRAGPDVRAEVRAELGVGPDDVVVGCVGRLVLEKGFAELFQAAEGLDDRFVVVCIGPQDPDKPDAVPPELIERAAANGVRFLGMRTDMERLYAAMDVFVLPSHREGFPRAAMEASAMGLPVVATDIRGCREVVDPGRNGLLVPVGDPRALREAIEELADPQVRRRLSAGARTKAEEAFDERRVVEKVMATYLRLARQRGLSAMAEALSGRWEGAVSLRPAEKTDASFMAAMHQRSITTGFLSTLGTPFLRLLYRALVTDPDGVAVIAEDDSGPVGFVAGTRSTSAFYRRFAVKHGWRAGLVVLPRLVRPGAIRRLWESFRYGTGEETSGAELLAMAVAADRRGRGIGVSLGRELLSRLETPTVRVVVGSDNHVAIAAYKRMGFVPHSRIEVHKGESSEVLEWSQS